MMEPPGCKLPGRGRNCLRSEGLPEGVEVMDCQRVYLAVTDRIVCAQFLARYHRHRETVREDDDLEREISRGCPGDNHLSDGSQIDQGGDGGSGKPDSAAAFSGKVVRGYQVLFLGRWKNSSLKDILYVAALQTMLDRALP
jgi:hypothetical protein